MLKVLRFFKLDVSWHILNTQTEPHPKKCLVAFGAIKQVAINLPNFFCTENGRLQLGRSIYFVYSIHKYRDSGLKHPVLYSLHGSSRHVLWPRPLHMTLNYACWQAPACVTAD